jgi:hypothetical protein
MNMSMFGFKRRAKEREMQATKELATKQEFDGVEYERGYQQGKEDSQKIADAVDETIARLVKPWADHMLDIFTQKISVKVIFCDENPERESRFGLAEFNQAVDVQLGQIIPDVRAKLSAYEQLCRESNALDGFEFLLKSRFDSLRHNMMVKAIEITGCVVGARKYEMGLDVEQGAALANGRRILKGARAMPVSLTEDDKKTLKQALALLDDDE